MFQLFECIGTWLRPTKLNVLYWRIICNSLLFFAICDKLLMKRRWTLAKPRNVFYSLRLVIVRKPWVNCFYFTGPGLLKLRPIGWIRWLTKLRLISLGLISHLCPGLHAITNFTILCRKIAADRMFCTLRLSVTSSFFSLTRRGLWIIQTLQKLRKIGTTTISCNLLCFCSLLACLASQTALPNWTNSGKMAKNRCQNGLSYLTISRYCFVLFSLTREGPDLNQFRKKCQKLFRFLTFLFFLTSSSLSRNTDVNFPG